ncbi:hypothetical protein [Pelagibacterium halotolerans]|uniref:hypothetical protein n=1 Tax=Pelagibacterium halotolerans TaxID=531813 RepID=UPI001115187B|nr:hypothetical protein [Pelagibacterium halotolerans]QJR17443.1 hypothetical protein HKM20_02600 [Pelagibacterium halotolerans]
MYLKKNVHPSKLSLLRQHSRAIRKNKARRPRFPFQQNYNVKEQTPQGRFKKSSREQWPASGKFRQSQPPCSEAATLGAQGATASAVGALYGQALSVSTRQITFNDTFLTVGEKTRRALFLTP